MLFFSFFCGVMKVFILLIFLALLSTEFGYSQNICFKLYGETVFLEGDSSFVKKKFRCNCFDTASVSRFDNRLLAKFENSGYPFVKLVTDSVVIDSSANVSLFKTLYKSRHYTVSSIWLPSPQNINARSVYALTGISPGSEYSSKQLHKAQRALSKSDMFEVIQPLQTEFYSDSLAIWFFLKSLKSNRLSLTAALSKDQSENKYFLTGIVDIFLKNNFGRGETIGFDWTGAGKGSQRLNALLSFPFVFNLPLNPEASLFFEKSDTSCLKISPSVSAKFYINDCISLGVLWQLTRVISSDTLSDFGKTRINLYGVSIGTDIGNKKTFFKSDISLLSGQKQSDSLYFPMFRISVAYKMRLQLYQNIFFESRLQSQAMLCKTPFSVYEMYSFGGTSSLRGFDAASLRADMFATIQNNVRYVAGNNFSLFGFYDLGYYQKHLENNYVSDFPSGLGFGTGFVHGGVNIDFAWALGYEFGQLKSFKDTRLHFGISLMF